MRRTAEASRIAGVRALLVHAIDDEAARFYQKFEFRLLSDGGRTLLLPIETIIAAIA